MVVYPVIKNAASFLGGCGIGYKYANHKKREDEVRQGKNFYLAASPQFGQLLQLSSLISKLSRHLFPQMVAAQVGLNILTNVIPIMGFAGFLLCAAVKHEDYEKLVTEYHGSGYAYIRLPEKLDKRTVSLLGSISERAGDVMRAAMAVTSIALIARGELFLGGGVLMMTAYQAIDQMGLISQRISLFMELHLPLLSDIGILIEGNFINRVSAVFDIGTNLFPSATYLYNELIDDVYSYAVDYFSADSSETKEKDRVTIRQIDALPEKHNEMSLKEILEILDASSEQFTNKYKINPAHCSNWSVDLSRVPTDRHFIKLQMLFDKIQWEEKYALVSKKLQEDDRFIDFLSDEFEGVSKKELKENTHHYIERLAEKKGVAPQKYAADWLRAQMGLLIGNLSGTRRIKGQQQDLEESIYYCSILLPYYESIESPIELEDFLLKIAIEGGDYCARGLKRSLNEVLWGVVHHLKGGERENPDPKENYENECLNALQERRSEILLSVYTSLTQEVPDKIKGDVHAFDIYRQIFSLGFTPMTSYERRKVGMVEILLWKLIKDIRYEIYDEYSSQLDEIIHEVGEMKFGSYFQGMINDSLLTPDEKECVFNRYSGDGWGEVIEWEEINRRFHRILLVKLGVLIPKEAA